MGAARYLDLAYILRKDCMLFDFFKKKSKVKSGDIVLVKKEFLGGFPNISLNSILTVEQVENQKAIVVFMSDKGDKIFRESIPVEAIVTTG